jgi:hypothetical protein
MRIAAPMNAAHTRSVHTRLRCTGAPGQRLLTHPAWLMVVRRVRRGSGAHPAYALLSVLRTNVGRGCSSTPRSLDKQSPPQSGAIHMQSSSQLSELHRCARAAHGGNRETTAAVGRCTKVRCAPHAVPFPTRRVACNASDKAALRRSADHLAVIVEGIEHELLQPTLCHHRHLAGPKLRKFMLPRSSTDTCGCSGTTGPGILVAVARQDQESVRTGQIGIAS